MTSTTPHLDARRTAGVSPLISPALLRSELPVDDTVAATVTRGRDAAVDVLTGRDDRLVVVVGPCSIHDADAYFEKPRTTVGWKGLINDPDLDGTFQVNKGLRIARSLLRDITALGLPVGCEFLDPITPQYIADLVSWGSIGARTAASQVHRQLCSALSMPIGIKNSTDGDVQIAVDGARASAESHVFMGINPDGLASLITTTGNPDCHVILRGGSGGPNYSAEHVSSALGTLTKAGLPERLIVDASHGNSGKDHRRQPVVAADLASRIAAGEKGVVGVMLESFLVAGRQEIGPDMVRGCSVTDACMDWDTTASVLDGLAAAVRARR